MYLGASFIIYLIKKYFSKHDTITDDGYHHFSFIIIISGLHIYLINYDAQLSLLFDYAEHNHLTVSLGKQKKHRVFLNILEASIEWRPSKETNVSTIF